MNNYFALLLLLVPVFVKSQTYQKPVPTAYHLKITVPDLATSKVFEGNVQINFTVSSASSYILLDAETLSIADSKTDVAISEWIKSRKVWMDVDIASVESSDSTIKISFNKSLIAGTYRININFTGEFQDTMQGFAKVPFHYNNEERYLGVTSFEPTFAKKVFPCFTDPSHRTAFILEVTVSKSQVVLSNVKPSQVHNVTDTTKVFVFDLFPVMPIYQLGWAVFDYTSYLLHSRNATSDTVIHTRAPYPYNNHTAWSCQHTANLVNSLDNYLHTSYPLEKIEQVVVPQFFTGSSVGWGFLSYSEETILVSPNITSQRDMQGVAVELSRGIVEQWFGSYVSTDSWQNLWLFKGFSEYLKYVFASTLNDLSDWELNDHLVVELIQKALALDSENNSLTITSEDEQTIVDSAYSESTTYKGAAIIRMLHSLLGDDNFKNVLQTFFSSYEKQTCTLDDFWNNADEIIRYSDDPVNMASKSVSEIMSGWISLKGHPIVNVSSNQTHYLIAQSVDSDLYIPITYVLQNSPSEMKTAWLEPNTILIITATSTNQWILVNVNLTGFYRVNYDSNLWLLLHQQLLTEPTVIPRLSRSQLIDDVFNLAMSGVLSTEFLMSFTGYLRKEVDYFPWYTALTNYQTLLDKMYGYSSYSLMKDHLLRLMDSVISTVTFVPKTQDSHTDKLRQSLVLEKACALGHSVCLQKAVSMLRSWMAQTFYDPDLSMSLLCAGVGNSSADIWWTVKQAFSDSVVPSVRANLLTALTCSRNSSLINEFLTNLTLSATPPLNKKDKTIFLETLTSTPSGAEMTLDWLLLILTPEMNESSSTEQPTTSSPLSHDLAVTLLSSMVGSDPNDFVEVYSNHTPAVTVEPSSNVSEVAQNSNRKKRDVSTTTLTETDIKTLLNLVVPKLTTLEQGTKLEKFLNNTDIQLSNETRTFIQNITNQIYEHETVADQYNGKLTVWLSNAATGASSQPTTPFTSQADSTTPTPKPSSASITRYSLVSLVFSAIVLTLSVNSR